MLNMEKFMELAMLGERLAEKLLLKRFLLGMASILVLVVIIGAVIAALLVIALYLAYRLLLEHGLSEQASLLSVGGIAVVVIIALSGLTLYRFRELHRIFIPRPVLAKKISHAAEEFVIGLLTPGQKPID